MTKLITINITQAETTSKFEKKMKRTVVQFLEQVDERRFNQTEVKITLVKEVPNRAPELSHKRFDLCYICDDACADLLPKHAELIAE